MSLIESSSQLESWSPLALCPRRAKAKRSELTQFVFNLFAEDYSV